MHEMPPDFSGLRKRMAVIEALTNRNYCSENEVFFALTGDERMESGSLRRFVASEIQRMAAEGK